MSRDILFCHDGISAESHIVEQDSTASLSITTAGAGSSVSKLIPNLVAVEGAADKNTTLILGMKRQLAGKAGCNCVIYLISSAAEESICWYPKVLHRQCRCMF